MNYYEHHLGDYAKDTVHLTMVEDGAYRRLLDVYYVKELPLPAEESKIFKLARASTKQEKDAVRSILSEFFSRSPDGWHHKRCDEEIERYQLSQEGAEDKRENDKERQRRARERRKALFAELRSHDVVPAWDTKTSDLEAMLSRVTPRDASAPVTEPVTRDNTATQTPVPSPQTPVIPNTKGAPDLRAGVACKAMKQAGLQGVNPSHPELVALLDAGITLPELQSAAADAASAGKGFVYALRTAAGRRRDAANVGKLPPARAHRGGYGAERNRQFASGIADTATPPDPFTIDAEEPNALALPQARG